MSTVSTALGRACALAALATTLVGCGPATSHGVGGAAIPLSPPPNDPATSHASADAHAPYGGPCEGYPCTEAGARAMLWAAVRPKGPHVIGGMPGKADAVVDNAARRMQEAGYTPQTFQLAAQNLKKLRDSRPDGGGIHTAQELDAVNDRTHWLCPLWPLC